MHGREALRPIDVLTGEKQQIIDDIEQYKTRLTFDLHHATKVVQHQSH
jgi:hypothetical protein